MSSEPVVALGIGIVSAAASVGAAVVTAATGTDLGPWASGGAGAVAVGALAVVVKDFRAGNIVSFKVAELVHKQEEQAALAERRHEEREKRLEALIEDANERNEAYRIWIGTRRP